MSSNDWIASLLAELSRLDAHVEQRAAPGLGPAQLIPLPADDWGKLGQEAARAGCRWVAGWGEDTGNDEVRISACFEKGGVYLLARTAVRRATPVLLSHTPNFPGADRPERHTQDMLGVAF